MSFSVTAPKSLRELFDQLGLQEVPSTDGTVIMEMPVDERTINTAGGLQGGLIATMADVTAGQLASRATPFGMRIATTDLFIRYLRPIKVGPARAVARILRTGKRSVVVRWTSIAPTTTRSAQRRRSTSPRWTNARTFRTARKIRRDSSGTERSADYLMATTCGGVL
jgi:uncharacterized protein (TIGR00369 family)